MLRLYKHRHIPSIYPNRLCNIIPNNHLEKNLLRSLLTDFNSYFASVEQQEKPALRGKPVAIVPMLADTTCCIAASYEAKAFGIKTGTQVREAKLRCPEITLIEARHELYVQYHQHAMQLIDTVAPIRRVMSIDEAESELTGSWRQRDKALEIAGQIKKKLRSELGECMRVSIGIAPNTLLAKLASNMRKPDGLTVLESADIPSAILHLAPNAINGIGPRMWQRLQEAGLDTMSKLYAAPRDMLRVVWGGTAGSDMYDCLRGEWQEIQPVKNQSLSHSHVLPPDMRNPAGALAVLNRLTQKIAMRLRAMNCYATEFGVSISPQRPYTKQRGKQPKPQAWQRKSRFSETHDTSFLLHTLAEMCASGMPDKPVAVSIWLSGLLTERQYTPDLFADLPDLQNEPQKSNNNNTEKRERLLQTIDQINRTYGKNTIYFASAKAGLDQAPMRIAFAHIPDLENDG